jgi:hypothetical protein
MRILVAIPHYFHLQQAGTHGSSADRPRRRAKGLVACVTALHQFFGQKQGMLNIGLMVTEFANQLVSASVDIIICTTHGRHLLSSLSPLANLFSHRQTKAEPELLGFEQRPGHRSGRSRHGARQVRERQFPEYLRDQVVRRSSSSNA